MTMSAPGTEAFKQDFAKWEDLKRQATQALENVESSISKKLQAKQARDRLAAGTDDAAPPEYRKQVDSYFKAIAGKKKPLGHAFCVRASLVAGHRSRGGCRARRRLFSTGVHSLR